MDSKLILQNLTTKALGRTIVTLPSCPSTNIIANQLARENAKDGTLVICDIQTQGKGRNGRQWLADESTLCFSLILKPRIDAALLPRLTIGCGVGVNRAMQSLGINSQVKWPNDILVNGKKLCGILFEGAFLGNECDYIIGGIGINVSGIIDDSELSKISTSIYNETGLLFKREFIAALIINQLEKVLESCYGDGFDGILEEFSESSCLLGKQVTIKGERELVGIVTGFDPLGRIEIMSENVKYRFNCGDVSLRY